MNNGVPEYASDEVEMTPMDASQVPVSTEQQEQVVEEQQTPEAAQEQVEQEQPVAEDDNRHPLEKMLDIEEGEQEPSAEEAEGEETIMTLNEEPEDGEAYDAEDTVSEEQVNLLGEHLAYHTDSRITSIDDINRLIEENEQLRKEAGKAQLQFKNEQQKALYEFASRFDDPISAGKKYLQVLDLKLETMDDKQKMFEAFMLDEQNSDLTREQGAELFSRMYDEKFEAMDDDILTKREIQIKAREAEKAILDIQEEARTAKSKDAEVANAVDPDVAENDEFEAEMRENISRAVQNLDKVTIQTKSDSFNYAIKSEQDRNTLQAAAGNLMGWLTNELQQFVTKNGDIDYDGYLSFVSELVFRDNIKNGLYVNGIRQGEKKVVTNIRKPNVQTNKTQAQEPITDNRSYEEKLMDSMIESMNR